MKQETFEKAQELSTRIGDLTETIDKVEENKADHRGSFPINLTFCYEEDYETLKQSVLNHLKAKRTKLQKEFDNLK